MSPLADALVAWQRTHGRHALPWQNTRDPYRVWLSEIMLQQTQVAAVLRYYARFLERFPDVATLAAAPLDDVLALWSGLGYYSRARNLHRCAQTVVNVLAELPGIGRSTAAAIAAFCHEERVSILDGNVKRVLTRVLAFDGDLAQQAQERVLWQHATALLPADRTDMPAYTQGLMDLGATVCALRQPDCLLCPLSGLCAARASGRMTDYPVRTRKLKRSRRENWCLWLQTADAVWLQQRPDSGIWAGLWSLPLFDDAEALRAAAGAAAARVVALPGFVHVLTHLDWTLHPHRLDLATPEDDVVAAGLGDGRWWPLDQLDRIGLPAPFSRLLLSR
jgi:A/G-specific adenine glycosylase